VLAAVAGEAFPLEPVSRRPRASTPARSPGGQPARGQAPVTGRGEGPARKPSRRASTPAEEAPAQVAGEAAPLENASAGASADDEEDGPFAAWLIAGGALALAAAIWGGWLLYRRRLP
jgi:hypothetical protein